MPYLSTNTTEIANDYAKRGLHVFPCHSISDGACTCGKQCGKDAGKHPITTNGGKDATTNPETVKRFFTGNYAIANIGIATGEQSGVVVVDIDDLNALRKLENEHEPLPKTWLVETGSGGKHYYFRYDNRCHNLTNATKIAGDIDIKTTGGYVIAPPSLHLSGNRYRWIVSPDETELATLPEWLLKLIPTHGATSKALIAKPATTEIEKARLYLAKCPVAVSGQGGNKQTFAVICRLIKLFGTLSDDELLDALQDWNSRCVPSWKESELRQKIGNARAKVVVNEPDTEAHSYDDNNLPPTIDEDAYIGLAGEIVKAIEPETEADPAAVLLTLLTVFGSVIGKECS
jgi:putative DNA primase/helicase